MNTQRLSYHDGDTRLSGFLFWQGPNQHRRPGILVVHGGAGLDDHARARARGLAELGYVTFACDMYGDGVAGNRERVMAQITGLRNDRAKLCRRAAAGLQVLASQPQVDGRLAAVGYCFGGLTVLELARSGADVTGAISVHGSLVTAQPAQRDSVKAKILVCHGALDPHIPISHVNAFMEEMNAAAADYQLFVFGGAMHGFTHEATSSIPGVAYHSLTDARSSAAIQAFLAELFRPDQSLDGEFPTGRSD